MHHGILCSSIGLSVGNGHLSHAKQTSCFCGHGCTGWRCLDEDRWNPAPGIPKMLVSHSRDFSVSSFCPQHQQRPLLCTSTQAPLFQQCWQDTQHLCSFQHPQHTHLINDQLQSRFESAEDSVGINKPQPKVVTLFIGDFPFILN